MKVKVEVKVWDNPKTCNDNGGWGDCCNYLTEYNSCELFRKKLKYNSKPWPLCIKCEECLKAIKGE